MDTLSFGEITYLYKGLNDKRVRSRIAKVYNFTPKQLDTLIKQAVQMRNIVYHDNHLLFYKTSLQRLWFIQNTITTVIKCMPNIKYNGCLYAIALLSSLLEPIGEGQNFLNEVKAIFDRYDLKEIKVI
jgi:abortive infection bacteriophage resistance protein